MTTWNTIIVDDERIIREGLSQYVPWKQLGYHDVPKTPEKLLPTLKEIKFIC